MTTAWFVSAVALLVAAVALHAHGSISVVLWALGALARRSRPGAQARPRVAAIVSAHDEEDVIEGVVASLVGQRYPPGRLAAFVVADNCTDQTAERARAAGATVFERETDGPSGKSDALAFALTQVREAGDFDAIAVFDADNVVAPDFFERAASRLDDATTVVQGLIDAKNPTASWVAASSALGFWGIAGVVQAPREALGLSSTLMGTGWVASMDACVETLPRLRSLTDDLEMGALFALSGRRVAFEPAARVFDEKPGAMRSALGQRHRWMQGRWTVATRYLGALIGYALSRRPSRLGDRIRAIDVAAGLVTPSLSFTAVCLALVAAAQLGLLRLAPHGVPWWTSFVPPEVSLGAAGAYYAVTALAIARFVSPPSAWLYFVVQPLYLVWSVPLAVSGFVFRRRPEWRHTEHGSRDRGASG